MLLPASSIPSFCFPTPVHFDASSAPGSSIQFNLIIPVICSTITGCNASLHCTSMIWFHCTGTPFLVLFCRSRVLPLPWGLSDVWEMIFRSVRNRNRAQSCLGSLEAGVDIVDTADTTTLFIFSLSLSPPPTFMFVGCVRCPFSVSGIVNLLVLLGPEHIQWILSTKPQSSCFERLKFEEKNVCGRSHRQMASMCLTVTHSIPVAGNKPLHSTPSLTHVHSDQLHWWDWNFQCFGLVGTAQESPICVLAI